MALKTDIIGKPSDPLSFTYTWKDVVLYALGVGAGPNELDYVYEGRGPSVLPTFAVVPAFSSMLDTIARVEIPLPKVLHGEQNIVLHRPIPPSGTFRTRSTVTGIYDKGKGALCVVQCNTVDEHDAPLFDNQFSIFVRGEGGFGGDRGPEPEKAEVPEGKAPDFEVTETIPVNQALIYRLSGDLNPLHADPAFSQKAGFPVPILHGLCTYGYAGRAIVHKACGGDATKLRRFGARFAGVVVPGETITTRGWHLSDGNWVVGVVNGEGKPVITNGLVRVG
jgi:acyl dehydratase